MATDAQIEALFRRLDLAATNATGAMQSGTNLPDVRNIPSTSTARVVTEDQMARDADLEAVRRPGVPLNTQLGAPAGTRFSLAFTSNTPDAIKTLQAKYGPENIAISPAGKLVIRNLLNEETGTVQDMIVDEEQMSAKDMMDLVGAIPEVLGAIAGMRTGRAIPGVGQAAGKIGFARDVLAGSIGGQVGGELAQRALAETQSTLSESLASRAKGAAVDAAFSAITGGAAALLPKGVARLSGPLSGNQTFVQTEAVEAIERIKDKTGIGVQLTIGEETGSPLAMGGEALLEKVPGSKGAIRRQKAAQEQQLRDIQKFMLGQGPLPSESSVGLDAVKRLKEVAEQTETLTTEAKQKAASLASAEILSAFDTLSVPSRQMYKRPVGQAIRTKAQAELDSFKETSRALYDDVYATPGANDPIIPTAPLKKVAQEIKADLPKRTQIVEEVSQFVDAQKRPIVRTTTGKEVLREFVPKELKKFVDELASGLDPKMPLNEVVQMRQIVNDAIDQSDVLPGIGTRFLKKVSHALTSAIDEGVKSAPDPALAKKLSNANEYYKTNRPRFERRGIVEIFRDPEAPGYVGDAEIVRRISAGEVSADRYFDFRDFLGKDSNEFKMLKRAVLDDIYDRSKITGQGDVVDAKSFIDSVRGLDRQVSDDLFGSKMGSVVRNAEALGALQGKIEVADLEKLLSSGTPSMNAIKEAVNRQKNLDLMYRNDVIKKFAKGEIESEQIKPEEFVSRYLTTAQNADEIKGVMALMQDNPDLTESIRRKTLEKFFADAARKPDPIDITKQVAGDPTRAVSGPSMMKALGDANNQEKLTAVLGTDTMNLLKDLVRVESALGEKEAVAKTVGGLVGGGILSRLMKLDFKDAMAIAKYKLAAYTLANPTLRGYLTRQVAEPDTADLARAIIASTPFIQATADEFKDVSGTAAFLNHMNDALHNRVDSATTEQRNPPSKRDSDLENFIRGLVPTTP